MTVPTIHSNGTSRESLICKLGNAQSAIEEACNVLAEAEPNGRDYYPQGLQALRYAINEHQSRLERLESVKNEIGALILAIYEAGK